MIVVCAKVKPLLSRIATDCVLLSSAPPMNHFFNNVGIGVPPSLLVCLDLFLNPWLAIAIPPSALALRSIFVRVCIPPSPFSCFLINRIVFVVAGQSIKSLFVCTLVCALAALAERIKPINPAATFIVLSGGFPLAALPATSIRLSVNWLRLALVLRTLPVVVTRLADTAPTIRSFGTCEELRQGLVSTAFRATLVW